MRNVSTNSGNKMEIIGLEKYSLVANYTLLSHTHTHTHTEREGGRLFEQDLSDISRVNR